MPTHTEEHENLDTDIFNVATDIADLRKRVAALEAIVQNVETAMEDAKKNPMIANVLRMMGL